MINHSFLKKTKPILIKLHVFGVSYSTYFLFVRIKNRLANYINKRVSKTVPVLLYHRVDNILADPVMLAVRPETFEEHIKYINKFYRPISLSELVKRIKNKTLFGDEICVTFDDGYRDNLINALPILAKYGIPATIFVTTSNLGKQASFEWDMKYNNKDRASFLSEEEIFALAQHPLIEIGAHTHNHMRLSDLSEDCQLWEMEMSKNILESVTKKKVLHFAYPFGSKQDFSNVTKAVVRKLGFLSAFENTGLLGVQSSDIYSFPRVNIRECDTACFSKLLGD